MIGKRWIALALLTVALLGGCASGGGAGYDPEYAVTLYNLGNGYRDTSRPEDAVSAYREALYRDPSLEQARVNLYITLMDLSDYKNALPEIKELVKNNPDSITYKKELAYTYYLLRDTGKSRNIYLEVLEVDPSDSSILYNVAQLYEMDGKHAKAREMYIELHEQGDASEPVFLALGKIDERSNLESAIQWYELAYTDNQKSVEAVESLLRLYKEQENHRKVLDTYPLLEEALGRTGEATFRRAKYAMLNTSDYLLGLNDFQTAIDMGYWNEDEVLALIEDPSLEFLKDQFNLILQIDDTPDAEGGEEAPVADGAVE